jgi:hypothetical protein
VDPAARGKVLGPQCNFGVITGRVLGVLSGSYPDRRLLVPAGDADEGEKPVLLEGK